MIVILWIVFSFFVSAFAEGRKITAVGALILSLVLSPLVGLIFTLLSDKKNKKCSYCGSEMKPYDIFCPACDRDKKGVYKYEYRSK